MSTIKRAWIFAVVAALGISNWPPPWIEAQSTPTPITGSFSLTSSASAQIPGLSGQSTCIVSVGGTWTGAITITASGATLASPLPIPTSAPLKDELSGASTITADGVYSYHTYSATILNFSTVSSGTAYVQFQCSQTSSASSTVPITIASLPPVVVTAPTDAAGRLAVDLNTTPLPAPTATIGVTVQNTPGVFVFNTPAVICPAASYPCGFPTPIPTGTPYPAPAGTVFVSNTPGVTVQNTAQVTCAAAVNCPVNATQVTSPWVVSTPSAGPLPTASAGAAAPGSVAQSVAYQACIFAAGALPSVTLGNAIMQQCDASGRLIVNPQPQATIQVNTPAPLPTAATFLFPNVVIACPSTAPAAVNSTYSAICDSNGRLQVNIPAPTATLPVTTPAPLPTAATYLFPNVVIACPSTAPAAVNSTYVATCNSSGRQNVDIPAPTATLPVTTPAPQATMATNLYQGVVQVGPSTAPAVVNSAYTAVVDSVGNTSTKICANVAAQCVNPTASPNAAASLNKFPTSICANNAGTDNCAGVNASQQLLVAPVSSSLINTYQCSPQGGTVLKAVIAVSASAATTTVVAINGSQVVYLCGYSIYIQAGTLPSFQLIASTVGSCASGNVNITGVYGGIAGAIGELFNSPYTGQSLYTSPAGGTICIVTGGTTPTVNGTLWYVQQ